MIPPLRYSRPARDPQWLTLEVCREFVRNKCGRSEDECKYAHPPPQVEVQNTKVICCFDSLLGRCHRIEPPCKYFHPPQHLKDQLSQARRSSLLSQMSSQQQQQQQPSLFNLPSFITAGVLPLQNSLVLHNNPPYNHPHSGGGGGGGDETYRQLLDSLLPPLNSNWLPSIRPPRSDRLEVCREFQRGVCTRQMSDCKFAHPPPGVALDPDNYVTVCMDFLKERCTREMCKYFHPPLHLQTRSLPSPSTPNLLQQQLIQQQLYQQQQHQQQQQQQLLQQIQQQQQRSSLTGSGLASSSMVAWPILPNVQPIYQQSSLILSLLSLHQQQQQQQQQQQLQIQLHQQQLQQQQQPVNQSLQQQMILSSSLTGLPPNTSFRPPQ